MSSSRERLVIILGGKCKECPESDMKMLQLDHINNDGNKDRELFKGNEAMYVYYLNHLEEAQQKLQVLCANHNWKKRLGNHSKRLSEEIITEEKKQHLPIFFDEKEIDGTTWIIWKDNEYKIPPFRATCPKCQESDWDLLYDKEEEDYYIRCRNCYFDLMLFNCVPHRPIPT